MFDDATAGTALVANTPLPLTLSTTAATIAVDQGDNIEVVVTVAGTIVSGTVVVYFENF